MVGAINADLSNGNRSFDLFLQNAKSITNPPTIPSGGPPALTGVGALATATPVPINGTSTSASSSSTSSTSSTTSTTSSTTPAVTQTQVASNSHSLSSDQKGGIAGGIIGAAVVVILLALLFMSYQRGRRYRKEAKVNRTLHSQSSRDMSHIDRPDLLYGGPLHDNSLNNQSNMGQFHRSQGSASVADSLEQDSTAGPSINIKELAAEIAKNMRETTTQERGRQTQDVPGLEVVPEQLVANAVSRAESARGADSIRGAESARGVGGRQLPRPPPAGTKRSDDTFSVDTLPAYVSGQSR